MANIHRVGDYERGNQPRRPAAGGQVPNMAGMGRLPFLSSQEAVDPRNQGFFSTLRSILCPFFKPISFIFMMCIIDVAFYLATLPRPDIGLGKERIELIESIIGAFDVAVLQEILRQYKQGLIESDDFTEVLIEKLRIKEELATTLEEKVFHEFKELTPVSTNQTLRSHMTAGWYATLEAMQDKHNFPVTFFSVGPRYRNEQREDAASEGLDAGSAS